MLMNQKTDLSHILRQLHEIELLKKILLTDDQYRMFKKLPKQNLLEDIERKRKEQAGQTENLVRAKNNLQKGEFEEESDEFQLLYDRLNEERELTPVNDKLLALLERCILGMRQREKKRRRTDGE